MVEWVEVTLAPFQNQSELQLNYKTTMIEKHLRIN